MEDVSVCPLPSSRGVRFCFCSVSPSDMDEECVVDFFKEDRAGIARVGILGIFMFFVFSRMKAMIWLID